MFSFFNVHAVLLLLLYFGPGAILNENCNYTRAAVTKKESESKKEEKNTTKQLYNVRKKLHIAMDKSLARVRIYFKFVWYLDWNGLACCGIGY